VCARGPRAPHRRSTAPTPKATNFGNVFDLDLTGFSVWRGTLAVTLRFRVLLHLVARAGHPLCHRAAGTATLANYAYVVGEHAYVRNDVGQLREQGAHSVDTDTWHETAYSGLSQILELFAGRVAFTAPQRDTVSGRSVTRYRVRLAPADAAEAAASIKPSPTRLAVAPLPRWRELAKPLELSGELWLDPAAGVVLGATLEARLEIADRAARPTQLTVSFAGKAQNVGSVEPVSAPANIAEFRRIPFAGDPLAFFRSEMKQ
jgi:hypothetical protein